MEYVSREEALKKISIDKVETVRKFKVNTHPGFFIEEFNDGLNVEFWLCHEDYGIKMHMFGLEVYLMNNLNHYDDNIKIILGREIEGYINIYMCTMSNEEI